MQDVLGLGGDCRMNLPGKREGYWEWRFAWEQVLPEQATCHSFVLPTYLAFLLLQLLAARAGPLPASHTPHTLQPSIYGANHVL